MYFYNEPYINFQKEASKCNQIKPNQTPNQCHKYPSSQTTQPLQFHLFHPLPTVDTGGDSGGDSPEYSIFQDTTHHPQMGFVSFLGRLLFASLFILSAWQMYVNKSTNPVLDPYLYLYPFVF